jgi:hypothetical protein
MTVGTGIVLALVVLAVVLSIRYIIKNSKSGGCLDCPSRGACDGTACRQVEKMNADLEKADLDGSLDAAGSARAASDADPLVRSVSKSG